MKKQLCGEPARHSWVALPLYNSAAFLLPRCHLSACYPAYHLSACQCVTSVTSVDVYSAALNTFILP